MTLSSTSREGGTTLVNRTAHASSSSRTATSNLSRPDQRDRSTAVVTTPLVKLLPVSLVNTRNRSARMVAIIFVVVVLPLVPVTTTTPSGRPAIARGR